MERGRVSKQGHCRLGFSEVKYRRCFGTGAGTGFVAVENAGCLVAEGPPFQPQLVKLMS